MEVQINEKIVEKVFDPKLTLGELINQFNEDLKKEDKVICQICVDNKIIHESEEPEAFKTPLEKINLLGIMADNVDNLIINSLNSLKNLIPELGKVLSSSSYYFKTGETQKALKLFSSSLEALEIVPTILDGVRASKGLNFSTISLKNMNLKELEELMLETIKNIFESQNSNDFVNLGDLIEYELVPNLGLWFEAIPILENICMERIVVNSEKRI
jgi:hypothetical protein